MPTMTKDQRLFAAIGARLILRRSELGLSQAAMAKALGVSSRAYHSYEKGMRGIPVEAAVSLVEQFGGDLNWLMRGMRDTDIEHKVKALELFERELDAYLEGNGIKLKHPKRSAIAARWYRSYLMGTEIPIEDVQIWIELLTDPSDSVLI